jgi:LysM repeat protein
MANCTPQRSWPQYMVFPGDTLGFIAEATNSTIAQLTAANCLANPELIYVGQLLYVPVLPAPPPPITVVQTVVVTVEQTVIGTIEPDGTVEPGITVMPTADD